MEVHGVLWVSGPLRASIFLYDLHAGLLKLDNDPLVFVPNAALGIGLARIAKLLGK